MSSISINESSSIDANEHDTPSTLTFSLYRVLISVSAMVRVYVSVSIKTSISFAANQGKHQPPATMLMLALHWPLLALCRC